MFIPQTGRKKALFIADVQDGFLVDTNLHIVPYIIQLIQNGNYDMIVYSLSYNKPESLWYKQIGRLEDIHDTETLLEIKQVFDTLDIPVYKVHKLTKSMFKADEDVLGYLQKSDIEEIHICGLVSYDCVYATAQESFDLGYYTFVIEEACEARTTPSTHIKAMDLLRYMNMTNNSEFVDKDKIG